MHFNQNNNAAIAHINLLKWRDDFTLNFEINHSLECTHVYTCDCWNQNIIYIADTCCTAWSVSCVSCVEARDFCCYKLYVLCIHIIIYLQ